MISYFAFYKVIFMVQLLIAEALFTFRLRRRSFFWLRWGLSAALCLASLAGMAALGVAELRKRGGRRGGKRLK